MQSKLRYDYSDGNMFINTVRHAMACNTPEELDKYKASFWSFGSTDEKPIYVSHGKYSSSLFGFKKTKIVTFIVNPIWMFSVERERREFVEEFGRFLGFPIYTYIPSLDKEIPDAIERVWNFDSSNKENPPKAIRFGDCFHTVSYREVATEYERKWYDDFEKEIKLTFTVRRENSNDTCNDVCVDVGIITFESTNKNLKISFWNI
jgi:hypothetical protein